ncbi:winged helix-turn-helix domain-containing protein [Streptomyces sp. NBC_01465]|uniref:winged helix-turn-helix domain-containing protein n=1 Tax=Streptomyces sp. NBC_01465 TaxID=2903878 RepID=UPI002E345BC6|nr:winged helix-turn-helix domain-containing protein [Streptomyces sp. NBC_01465]
METSHRTVADELRARIKDGSLQPGTRMPTQERLAREFGVERGTVRQALKILQEEQLLTHVTRGVPATVADVAARPAAAPQSTMVALATRIDAAFAAPQVEIDALCLKSASLNLALSEPIRGIHAGRMKPAAVTVRVLLPSRDIELAFPTPVADGTDGRLHRNWLDQRNAQGQVLRSNLLALRASHEIDVTVEFRALPFTPPVKLYLLNGAEALFGYYLIGRREEEFDHESLELFDIQGTQSTLFPFAQGAGVRDATFVEQSQLWFDAIWNTISSPLSLAADAAP